MWFWCIRLYEGRFFLRIRDRDFFGSLRGLAEEDGLARHGLQALRATARAKSDSLRGFWQKGMDWLSMGTQGNRKGCPYILERGELGGWIFWRMGADGAALRWDGVRYRIRVMKYVWNRGL